jgi:hypothetical protein
LEVLLAMAIFLLALVAIGQLVDFGLDSAIDAQSQSIATRLAQSKLAEAEGGAVDLTTGSSGTFDTEPEWSFEISSVSTEVTNVYVVSVTVSRQFRNRTKGVTLSQMILDPQAMGGATEIARPTATTGTTGTGTGTTGSTSP